MCRNQWRNRGGLALTGMSYLKYANLCSDMVRAALLPELRAKAKTREVVHYKEAIWKDGKPEKQSERSSVTCLAHIAP